MNYSFEDSDSFKKFEDFMNSTYGNGHWSYSTDPHMLTRNPAPQEFDFLEYFLGVKLSVSPELWAKLGMQL